MTDAPKINMEKCCDMWEGATGGLLSVSPVALSHPGSMTNEQIEILDDGTWAVNGCCGGCFVLTGLKFCPWCGASRCAVPAEEDAKGDIEAAMQAYSDARDNLDRPAMTAAAEQYRKAVMRRIEQESKK